MTDMPSFEELEKLHREDPEAFEELRLTLVNKVIDSAPESNQQRLRGLQFRIDGVRKTSKNSTDALIKITTMMKEHFEKLRQALNELTGKEDPLGIKFEPVETNADILQFKQKSESNEQ